MRISFRRNKYIKYKLLKKYRKLRRHIPDTRKLRNKTLWKYLNKYGDIILKPIDGKRGFGVIRVSEGYQDNYEIHTEGERRIVQGNGQLYDELNKLISSRKYIVQRRIPLATVKGRPFDIRVIVQRKSNSKTWKVTGRVAKLAGKGYIVTNIERSKGTVLRLKKAIRRSSIKHLSATVLTSKIDKVALRTASKLSKLYKNQYIYGFDMGLDQNGRVWIIEANLSPMLTHFKKLHSKKMYRRIIRYKYS